MGDIKTQNIQFIQACPPALDAGEYVMSADMNVTLPSEGKGVQDVKTIHTAQEFSVKGTRFELNPENIDSVFPPANQNGSYGNCLPHIIIHSKTFAWERDLDANKTMRLEAGAAPVDIAPWVAILSFTKEEAPEIVKNTAKAIISPEAGIVTGKIVLDTEVGENEATPCLTIDIPSELFCAIAPSEAELKFLAHSRHVDTENKDATTSQDGYYSIVIGNRFPLAGTPGVTNIAHLVSFEGLGEHLPGGPSPITDTNVKVRLISLTNWEYTVVEEPFDFKKMVENLSPAKQLGVPVSDGEPQQEVKQAFQMGYTALNHNLRTGEKTVSWYRGPFVPLSLDDEKMDCFPCADALLRYNPDTGMFDLSYSSAWQIGRLLALQNKSFATSLYQWRRNNNQMAAFQRMRSIVNGKLSNELTLEASQNHKMGDRLISRTFMDYIRTTLGPAIMESAKNQNDKAINIGDYTGLKKNLGDMPGVLTEEVLNHFIGNAEELTSTIIDQGKEDM